MENTGNGIVDPGKAKKRKIRNAVAKIKLDFSKSVNRKIKPLHGINNSPLVYNGNLPELTDAGIPYVRLHDTGGAFGGTYLVDVPNLFPDFDADPDDPASYEFAFTDSYLRTLDASKLKVFFRLGVTIENNYNIKPLRIHPPKNFEKWAHICEMIVCHYNEGWANGFHFCIEYWEIWNEPENPPMWTGTRQQFFELYRVTANLLKSKFPNIKVGGYSSCGLYAVSRPGASEFTKGFLVWMDEFLAYITARKTHAPLDFFSWHLYTSDPNEITVHADYVRKRLDTFSLSRAESIFNEWNLMTTPADPDCWTNMREMPGSTFVAAAFVLMQKTSVDKAMYYDASPSGAYCGLYGFPNVVPSKTYYAFKAFNELYKLGEEVDSTVSGCNDIYVLAAKNGENKKSAIIVNRNKRRQEVALHAQGVSGMPRILVLDCSRVLTETGYLLNGKTLTLPAESVLLLSYDDHLHSENLKSNHPSSSL